MTIRAKRKDYGYSRTVSYDASNHLAVICQLYGSVWANVLPYCLLTVAITVLLLYLLSIGIDCTISEWGHEFMSVLISFLIITKFGITLNLYFELQGALVKMGIAAGELVQLACTLSENKTNERVWAPWRSMVAEDTAVLLLSTVAMLTSGDDVNAWEIRQLRGGERLKLRVSLDEGPTSWEATTEHSRGWVQGYCLESDLNLRTPCRLANRLRSRIVSNQTFSDPLHPIAEQQILEQVNEYMQAYGVMQKYLTTPLPFPLVQMARIFLFFYIFTLPFAILSPELDLGDVHVLLIVFIMVYGFMGMECVCIELDDPFGQDPNDLPVMGAAKEILEDIYLSIYEVDGLDAARDLKAKMTRLTPNDNGRSPGEADPLMS